MFILVYEGFALVSQEGRVGSVVLTYAPSLACPRDGRVAGGLTRADRALRTEPGDCPKPAFRSHRGPAPSLGPGGRVAATSTKCVGRLSSRLGDLTLPVGALALTTWSRAVELRQP